MNTNDHERPNAIELPDGLVGLPDYRRFALSATSREGYFWLQSLEEPGLGFVLVDPFPYFDGYAVDIPATDLADLGPFDRSELLVLTVVTFDPGRGGRMTANLQGPIAVNLRTRRAKQLVIQGAAGSVRAELDVPVAAAV